jgi:hypothetical protein
LQITIHNINNMANKISTLKLIYNILTSKDETRDDWLLTIKMVHDYEMIQMGIPNAEYYESLFEKRILTNVHSIIRDWRKVQQDNEHLRGEEWSERQKCSNTFKEEYKYYTDKQYSLFSDEDLESMAKMDLD